MIELKDSDERIIRAGKRTGGSPGARDDRHPWTGRLDSRERILGGVLREEVASETGRGRRQLSIPD